MLRKVFLGRRRLLTATAAAVAWSPHDAVKSLAARAREPLSSNGTRTSAAAAPDPVMDATATGATSGGDDDAEGAPPGSAVHTAPPRDADLESFLNSLATVWREGEVRPTHRKEPKPRRDWRTRVDPFESAWPRVVTWLEAEPDRTAKELLVRLQVEGPDAFADGQLRTLQRRVKDWRTAAARRLVLFTADFADRTTANHVEAAPRPS